MSTFRIRVNPFDGVYIVRDPETEDSAMFGPLLVGDFRMENRLDDPWERGAFRVDRLDLLEQVPEQLEMRSAA